MIATAAGAAVGAAIAGLLLAALLLRREWSCHCGTCP